MPCDMAAGWRNVASCRCCGAAALRLVTLLPRARPSHTRSAQVALHQAHIVAQVIRAIFVKLNGCHRCETCHKRERVATAACGCVGGDERQQRRLVLRGGLAHGVTVLEEQQICQAGDDLHTNCTALAYYSLMPRPALG